MLESRSETYMNFKPLFVSSLLIALAAIFAFYILRRAGLNFSRRLPSLLELSVPLFLLGLAMLPEALPSAFASILHHPITSDYVHPIRADGTLVTETWVLARWWTPISRTLYAVVCVGMVWAVWNIFKSQDRRLNVFALCLGLVWTGLGAISNLRFPLF
jgi:hypothetical protein